MHPPALVTVTPNVIVPGAPAVNVMLGVFAPLVIVPLKPKFVQA